MSMPAKRDITGLRSGKLIALRFSHVNSLGKSVWICRCDCGTEKQVVSGNIVSGGSKSCGCTPNRTGRKVKYNTPDLRELQRLNRNLRFREKYASNPQEHLAKMRARDMKRPPHLRATARSRNWYFANKD